MPKSRPPLTAPPPLHKWNQTPAEARALQSQLATQVELCDRLSVVRLIGGVDVGFENGGEITRAALVVLTFPDLQIVERQLAKVPTTFPYVPGLLSFREIPAIVEAWSRLQQKPDLLLCDGQGIAHPRRLGIASHLGLWLDVPTIGVAKKKLTGRHEPVPDEKGAWVPLQDKGEVIGAVLRSRQGVLPLYVSPGHRVSQATALDWVLRCLTRYRLPEPTRQAHRLASLEKQGGPVAVQGQLVLTEKPSK
ncbi:MAG TPA: deoxyribonuclease V [Dongiaceae bacterium]|nr:deoxyribonuclease V [Dongiaceae bacterium]